jgi:hypothetical protein
MKPHLTVVCIDLMSAWQSFFLRAALIALLLALPSSSQAQSRDTPHQYNPFGTPGETSPEMLAALHRMSEASMVEGRRGSLGHFRWSGTPPKLTHLGLWGSKVGNELMPLTSTMPDLQFVSFYESNLDDAGLEPLTKLPSLRYLSFTRINRYEKPGVGSIQWSYPFIETSEDRRRITGKGLETLVRIPMLESLDLLDTKVISADLAALAAAPKLSSLSLPMAMDEEAVKHLKTCSRLQSVTLGHREVTAEELTRLAAGVPLRRLTLFNAKLSDAALEALSKFESVQELKITECGLTDAQLSHLRGSPNLTSLLLERNEISGTGLAHLTGLNLKTLGLERNNISDETLKDLPQLVSLENLWLEYCALVTDKGIQGGILQSMTHLKELRIRGMTQVTDASLDDLVKFGHLKQISIRENKISPEGVERMKAAMPNTNVFK